MTDIIENFARKNKIIAGVCDAAPLKTRGNTSPFTPFVSGDINKRTDPAATLKGVQSIIVIGVGAVSLQKTLEGTARLSSLGANADYHPRVKNLLRELAAELEGEYKILADSPGLDERALAHRAGLGFFGRNGLLISRKFGSRFNIGCLLTTEKINSTGSCEEPVGKFSCPQNCNLCAAACPTNALTPEGFQVSRCLSYLTQKSELTADEEKLLTQNNQLYGCDICQDVCFFNAFLPTQSIPVNPQEWLAMDDAAFREKYGHTAMLWQGTEVLRRNARLLSARNKQRSRKPP